MNVSMKNSSSSLIESGVGMRDETVRLNLMVFSVSMLF